MSVTGTLATALSTTRCSASPFFAQTGPRGGTVPETPVVVSPLTAPEASANHTRAGPEAANVARRQSSWPR